MSNIGLPLVKDVSHVEIAFHFFLIFNLMCMYNQAEKRTFHCSFGSKWALIEDNHQKMLAFALDVARKLRDVGRSFGLGTQNFRSMDEVSR